MKGYIMATEIEFEKYKMKWKIYREYHRSKDSYEYTVHVNHLHGYGTQRFDAELAQDRENVIIVNYDQKNDTWEEIPVTHDKISQREVDVIVEIVLEDIVDYGLFCAQLDESPHWWDFEPVIPEGKALKWWESQKGV